MKWDIHLHSDFSDGVSTIKEIFQHAMHSGIEGIVVTDHDTVAHQKKAEEMGKKFGIKTVPGLEVTTPFGDILAIGVDFVPVGGLEEMVDQIHDAGGVAIAAHPFGGYWETPFVELPDILSLFDAWEVLNGGVSKDGNRLSIEFGLKHKVVGTAGSDAHYWSDVGSCFIEAGEDLIGSIMRGEVAIGTNKPDLAELPRIWNTYMGRD